MRIEMENMSKRQQPIWACYLSGGVKFINGVHEYTDFVTVKDATICVSMIKY